MESKVKIECELQAEPGSRQCTCTDCVPDDYHALLMPDDVSHVLDHEFPHNNTLLRSLLAAGGGPGTSRPAPAARPAANAAGGTTKRSLLTLGMNRLTQLLFDDNSSRRGQVWAPKVVPPSG